MKNITSQKILYLISMRPLSFKQMVSELKLKGQELITLSSLLDEMRFSRHHRENVVLGLTINYNDPALRREGTFIGPETYLYYRLDEVPALKEKGLLSREVPTPSVNLEEKIKIWKGFWGKER